MHTDLETLCIQRTRSLRNAIALMDRSRIGIVLVVDARRRLVGTVTDGDVRRAVLDRVDLNQPVTLVLDRKANTRFATPITASAGVDRNTCLKLLKEHNVLHLPLVDSARRVVGIVTLDEFLPEQALPLKAVVMAGGQGSRLLPLTEETPKPMLQVGDRPLLEIMIEQLREAGIKQVKVTTHHQAKKIARHVGDGKRHGIDLSIVEENRPLGTVGGLALMKTPRETTLVINGDILTQVDFRAMLLFHREHQGELTVAVRHYDITVPYGVIECNGPTVLRVREKPVLDFFVNAGIYLLEPSVYRYIPKRQRFDMPDLIQRLLDHGRSVVSFPVREHWLDIGQPEDYEQAQHMVKEWQRAREASKRFEHEFSTARRQLMKASVLSRGRRAGRGQPVARK